MSYNGSGSFSIDSTGQPVVEDTTISSSVFNALTADLATGLSTAICKDGQTTITANIPMSTFKITGLGDGSNKQDAATINNIVAGTGVYVGTVGGTANAITLTPSPAITAYAAGQRFSFIAASSNTSTVTVNVSSLGAKAITKNGTLALTLGEIVSGQIVTIVYDGTQFQLQHKRIYNGSSTASTSGTSIDFTSIPSGVRRVKVMFYIVSTNGTDALLVQLGDSGGVETSGYVSASTNTVAGGATVGSNSTAGFIIHAVLAANAVTGVLTLDNLDSDGSGQTWIGSGSFIRASGASETIVTAGLMVLSAHLDRVRITTTGGANTFDNGVLNISYEF